MKNDLHCEIIEKSTKNCMSNNKPLIYTFNEDTLTEKEMKEIGNNKAVDKYGVILDVRKEGSI